MADTFPASVPSLSAGPAIGAVDISYGSGDQTLTGVPRGFYVSGGSGALKVDMANGTTATFSGLVTGTVYSFAITKIYQSGSSATGVVLY